jgi:hypothetical protein
MAGVGIIFVGVAVILNMTVSSCLLHNYKKERAASKLLKSMEHYQEFLIRERSELRLKP